MVRQVVCMLFARAWGTRLCQHAGAVVICFEQGKTDDPALLEQTLARHADQFRRRSEGPVSA